MADAAAQLTPAVIERALARPERYASHEAAFWDDPYCGRQMLAAHLEPATDAASRRPDTIRRTVDHLAGALRLRPGDHLLDLGCGPGVYAMAFAGHGVTVSGIDLSPVSIDHAADAARAAGMAIDYRVGDYTTEPLGGPFDAAVLICLNTRRSPWIARMVASGARARTSWLRRRTATPRTWTSGNTRSSRRAPSRPTGCGIAPTR